MKGNTASILTEEQILDRLGMLDQTGRPFLRFISSHADVSPLAYYRTGNKNRGRGEENDTDELYMAMAIDLARDVILRADADMQACFARFSPPDLQRRKLRDVKTASSV